MDVVIGGFFTLVVAIIGAIAGAMWTNRHNDRVEKNRKDEERKHAEESLKHKQLEAEQQTEIVRQRLWDEVEFNLEKVRDLYKRVIDGAEGMHDEMELMKRVRFVRNALPSWQRVIWQTQAAQLPLPLGTSAHALNTFYSYLDDLQGYHDRMTQDMPANLIYNYDAWWGSYQNGRIPNGSPLETSSFRTDAIDFIKRTQTTWYQCEGLLGMLRNQANPVPKQLPKSES